MVSRATTFPYRLYCFRRLDGQIRQLSMERQNNKQMTTRGSHIRKRLLRNKGALFGLTVISISILTAVFAYFLAPDGSPDANRIIVEIGGRPPGFRQHFLLLNKE